MLEEKDFEYIIQNQDIDRIYNLQHNKKLPNSKTN